MPVLTAPPANARSDLAPTGNRGPVEQAVVEGALAEAGPETLVRTDVPQPDGSVRLYAAWTDGGGPLADHIDRVALPDEAGPVRLVAPMPAFDIGEDLLADDALQAGRPPLHAEHVRQAGHAG